jgi:hypothetical protein
MPDDSVTNYEDSDQLHAKLQAALKQAESASGGYRADPGRQRLDDVIEAWTAVVDPSLAQLLPAARRGWAAASLGAAWREGAGSIQ